MTTLRADNPTDWAEVERLQAAQLAKMDERGPIQPRAPATQDTTWEEREADRQRRRLEEFNR